MAHVDQNSVEIRQTQLAKSAAVMLSDGALALFVTYAIVVAFDILPPRLLDPAWMMKLALSLSVNMAIPLAAIAFLQVAAWMGPKNYSIQARRNIFGKIIRWAMLGFLLLLPLIGYSTWTNVKAIKIQNQTQKNNAKDATNRFVELINTATSPSELQVGLAALKGPNIPNELLNQPLPLLKQQSLLIVNQAYKSFLLNTENRASAQSTALYLQALKAFILSLIGAVTCAALSRKGLNIEMPTW